MARKSMTAIQATDPAWVIALRLAIHGVDPGQDKHAVRPDDMAASGEGGARAAQLEPAQATAAAGQPHH